MGDIVSASGDWARAALHSGQRAITSGIIGTGLCATAGGKGLKESAGYGVRFGAVDWGVDLGSSMLLGANSSSSSEFTSMAYLGKTVGAIVGYGVAHAVLPAQFPYINGSMMRTTLVHGASIYLGMIAGDRLRGQLFPMVGLGSYA